MTAEVNIAGWAGKYVDDLFTDLQTTVIENVIAVLSPYVWVLAGTYLFGLLLFAFAGRTEVMKNGVWILVKIFGVIMISQNIGHLNDWLLSPINAFLSLISNGVSASDATTVYGIADDVINKSMAVGDQAWQKAGEVGWRDWDIKLSWWLSGLVAGLGGMVMVAPATIAIIASNAIIHILFMLSPVFVLAIMMPFTAKYFINWTAAVGNSMMVIILAAINMSVAVLMATEMMEKIGAADDLGGPWGIIGMTFFMVGLFWVLIRFIFNMASTLAGGLSLSMPVTSSRIGQGATNAMYGAGSAPFRAMAKMLGASFNKKGGSLKG